MFVQRTIDFVIQRESITKHIPVEFKSHKQVATALELYHGSITLRSQDI